MLAFQLCFVHEKEHGFFVHKFERDYFFFLQQCGHVNFLFHEIAIGVLYVQDCEHGNFFTTNITFFVL
jgi:hypothetical protein